MRLSEQRVNAAAQNDGEWFDFPAYPGFGIKVKGTTFGPYRLALANCDRRAMRQAGRNGLVPPDVRERFTLECIIEHLLLDWRGLESDDGSAIPFSKDRAREFLLDPQYRPFADMVVQAAVSVGDQLEDDKADAEKNSAGRSAGA